jgi:aminoglycoside phosphotransferase (APT) family kinase protein
MSMHPGQVEILPGTVTRLVAAQFPEWQGQPVRRLISSGTVNALFRVGDEAILRFPLRPSADRERHDALVEGQAFARRLATQVTVEVPRPLGLGAPADGYPGWWSAYAWIPGETASSEIFDDATTLARDLAAFVNAVHGLQTDGRTWDGDSRGGPLQTHDGSVRQALGESGGMVDTGRLARLWEGCLAADHCDRHVWLHADLMPGNLLLREGRLAAVIDLEAVCIGDPAVDLMPAWNLLPPHGRDAAAWERGRGWALVQAIVALPYYVRSNPVMAATARRTLDALLEDEPS